MWCRHQPDAEVAATLRQMEVDIAIDLKGYTQWGRAGHLCLAARRTAGGRPSAIPASNGGVDQRLCHRRSGDAAPCREQPFGDEKDRASARLLPVQRSQPSVHRLHSAAAGPPREGFVFASFNLHRKITRPLFDIWMRLLAAVPGSVLWLLDDSANAELRAHAAARGVDPQRLIFAPHARSGIASGALPPPN